MTAAAPPVSPSPPFSNGGRTLWPRLLSALLVFVAVWCSNPRFERRGHDDDADDYAAIARDFGDVEVRDRPPLYPLILRVCMEVFGDRWDRGVAVLQAGMLSAAAVLVTDVLVSFAVPGFGAALVAVFCCSTPGLVWLSGQILPEITLALALTFVWRQTLVVARAGDRLRARDAVACGLANGAAALVKPVWVLGAAATALAVFVVHRKTPGRAWRSAAIILLADLALVLPWQLFLVEHYGQFALSRTGTANVNMAGLRSGMVSDGEGTPLFQFLSREGLLDQARHLTWDDFDGFTRVKNSIPWDYRTDERFEKAILRRDGLKLAFHQLRRMEGFFLVRPPPIERVALGRLGDRLRALYQRFYAAVFRVDALGRRFPTLAFLEALGLATCLAIRRDRPFGVVSGLMIAYYATIVALLVYQEPQFIRMRVAIEPVLLCLAAMPFCQFLRSRAARPSPPGL